jgi:hypothetical protein
MSGDFDTLNGPNDERLGTPTADRRHVFISRRGHPNAARLRAFDRLMVGAPWSENLMAVVAIDAALPNYHIHSPSLSPDGLRLVFAAAEDINMQSDLYLATRATTTAPFGTPVPLVEVNDPELYENDPWMSPDGNDLYFARVHVDEKVRRSEWGIYYAGRVP